MTQGVNPVANGTIKQGLIVASVSSTSATSVAANGYASATVDCSKSGYTPIGVVGIHKTGSASGYSVPSNYYFNGNTLTVELRNTSSSAATVNIQVFVLYQKT